jgi:hypothetical protein
MTDDECIATAMLHGAAFNHHAPFANDGSHRKPWVCYAPEHADEDWEIGQADTRGEAARNYCKRHNLLTHDA